MERQEALWKLPGSRPECPGFTAKSFHLLAGGGGGEAITSYLMSLNLGFLHCKVGLITLTPKYGMKIKHNVDSGCHGKGAYGSASNERDTTGFQNSDSSLINEEPGAGKWNDLPRLAQ